MQIHTAHSNTLLKVIHELEGKSLIKKWHYAICNNRKIREKRLRKGICPLEKAKKKKKKQTPRQIRTNFGKTESLRGQKKVTEEPVHMDTCP